MGREISIRSGVNRSPTINEYLDFASFRQSAFEDLPTRGCRRDVSRPDDFLALSRIARNRTGTRWFNLPSLTLAVERRKTTVWIRASSAGSQVC